MERSFLQRLLRPLIDVRADEAATAVMMFAYSFLAMTSYNIIQPLTRSKLISDLGAVNIPYVLMGLGAASGIVMVGYTRLYNALPRRWALPATQAVMAGIMLGFWALLQTGGQWVSVAFYIWGAIFSVLLISQFWTLANGIYDPRQAKRLFGFIGGGVMIGGLTGAAITAFLIRRLGVNTLLLWSAFALLACLVLVTLIIRREQQALASTGDGERDERRLGLKRAFQLLSQSKQVQLIAIIIGFGSVGGALIEQQLNMAAENLQGAEVIGEFLARVRLYLGIVNTIIQIWVTPRIHRYLGVGFALLLLPTNLGITAVLILATASLWAPAAARISDQAIRYTIDKTTREVLFLPLPATLRQEVKPFVDVTVDRMSRGIGAVLLLFLVQPWALGLEWYQLSYVSFGFMAVWFLMAVRAKQEYLQAFRRSIERRELQPAAIRLDTADLSTVETLMEELASPDEQRVLYAIEILESLEKRNLITPLLLHHRSPAVRARALSAIGGATPEVAERWLPSIQRMIADEHPEVRAAAISALANLQNEEVVDIVRPFLQDPQSRIATTAAVMLARNGRDTDVAASEALLATLVSDVREATWEARRDVAAALGHIPDTRFRSMLIALLYDPHAEVAAEAMRSVRALGVSDYLFVPALASLLRHPVLKSSARDTLVGYGEDVVEMLAYLLRDSDEDVSLRRRIPAVLARIQTQSSANVLVDALQESDGVLRFEAVTALGKLRQERPELVLKREPIESLLLKEGLRYFTGLTLHYNLVHRATVAPATLVAIALQEKMARTLDRVYRLLALIYPWKDIAAARYAIEHGDVRSRASALEYLDNILTVTIRKRLMPVLEDAPIDEKVRRANVLLKTRPRDLEETVLQLVNDEDQVVAASAIDLVEERQLWNLVNDVEFVLAHRDARDWFVFEAASWVLAAHRLPGSKRRDLWIEPLPSVQLAARLRQVPLFGSVSVDQLFQIAGNGRQVRYESGRTLYIEGALPDQLQFLLDGAASARSDGQELRTLTPPASLGLEQVLEGRAARETIRIEETSVCLVLSRDDLRTLLADNTALVQGLFRMFAAGPEAGAHLVIKSPDAAPMRIPEGTLKPIEKILTLRRVPVFKDISADEMRYLSAIAREVPLEDRSVVFSESHSPSLWIVIDGQLTLEPASGGRSATAYAGDVVAAYQTLAGTPIGWRAVAAGSGRALRIDRDELFDLLAQRPELLQQMFSGLFRSPTLSRADRAPVLAVD